ncbi:MAG: DMT family transporter [Pseudomonadota bacterium]
MTTTRSTDIAIVVFCAAMWGLWWYPVQQFENVGLAGPWIGLAMCACTLPVGLAWISMRSGGISPRGVLGALLIGACFMLYAVSVSYTDFIRAVLFFYFAPAWSTLIELIFFGRRRSAQCLISIACSFIGILLISRGEVSFDGLGAIGDWMALAAGMSWSIGASLVFSSREAEVSRVMVIASLGGVGSALIIAVADGSVAAGVPDFPDLMITVPWVFALAAVYVGTMMAGTMWGAYRLPPAVMSYLLSIEILGGVLSAALILGERYGWFEFGGTVFIIGAVLIEVVFAPSGVEKPVSAPAKTVPPG